MTQFITALTYRDDLATLKRYAYGDVVLTMSWRTENDALCAIFETDRVIVANDQVLRFRSGLIGSQMFDTQGEAVAHLDLMTGK